MDMPDEFELSLLPERRIDWRALAVSYGLQALAIVFLLLIGLLWPEQIFLHGKYRLTELVPRPALQVKQQRLKRPAKVVVARLLPPVKFEAPRLIVPKDVVIKKRPQQEIVPPKFGAKNEIPLLPKVSGAMPARIVYTGTFGGSAAATLNTPPQKVQTGGFGDPNGIHTQSKDTNQLAVAKLGSFDLPPGAGTGNGTGGAKGAKGTIASAGFGSGIAQPGQGDGRISGRGAPQIAGFASQEVATVGTKPRHLDSGKANTPVEILYKPNPAYTQAARQLQLQGEVLLEVMFGANGQLHVNRVVRGLGHGLDENAIAAADKIKFKPAEHDGAAVDSTAVVHVVFQLAM